MATIKSFTDLQQSKKLAEFLPIESADMSWVSNGLGKPFARTIPIKGDPEELCGCWSLAALIGVLPNGTDICKNIEGRYYVHGFFSDNPVDACVDAIKALHEQNLL